MLWYESETRTESIGNVSSYIYGHHFYNSPTDKEETHIPWRANPNRHSQVIWKLFVSSLVYIPIHHTGYHLRFWQKSKIKDTSALRYWHDTKLSCPWIRPKIIFSGWRAYFLYYRKSQNLCANTQKWKRSHWPYFIGVNILSSLAKQAGNTGCVIIKTLTEQEKVIMKRKGILNLLTEEKSYSQLTVPSNWTQKFPQQSTRLKCNFARCDVLHKVTPPSKTSQQAPFCAVWPVGHVLLEQSCHCTASSSQSVHPAAG